MATTKQSNVQVAKNTYQKRIATVMNLKRIIEKVKGNYGSNFYNRAYHTFRGDKPLIDIVAVNEIESIIDKGYQDMKVKIFEIKAQIV